MFDKMLVHAFISSMTIAKASDSKVYSGFVKYLVVSCPLTDSFLALILVYLSARCALFECHSCIPPGTPE